MILKSPSQRDSVLNWHQQGLIKDSDLETALQEADSLPTSQQWYEFVTQLLLWLGLISLGASMIFFLAFNWQELSRFSKFSSVQLSLFVTGIVYFFKRHDPVGSVAIAGLLCLLFGALLAIVGQTYQTGADPWQLFAVWSAFTLPFCIAHGSSILWLFFSCLFNLSLSLYFTRFRGIFDVLVDEALVLSLLFAINTILATLLSTGFYKQLFWMKNQLAPLILILIAGFLISWLAIWGIFDFKDMAWAIAVYACWISGLFYWFRFKDPNLMILAGISTSGVVVATAFMINTMADAFDGGALLFISLFIIFTSSIAGIWLKKLHMLLNEAQGDD